MIDLIIEAFLYILPAYIANGSAVLIGGRTPIDAGMKFFDGKRILGAGKTWKGLTFSVAMGTLTGLVISLGQLNETVLVAFIISLGAMFGDSIGSFAKRRFDLPRGAAVPFLDQWDFVLGAFLFAAIAARIKISLSSINIDL